MTKAKFYETYRANLIQQRPWAQDAAKLARYMDGVKGTIETSRSTWNCSGDALQAAWKAIGGKGKVTLKALRALPVE